MKKFTAGERIKHWDKDEDRLIALEKGDVVELRDELAEYFCKLGWGKAPGVATGERKTGVTTLTV
jgi:hypothetical protein